MAADGHLGMTALSRVTLASAGLYCIGLVSQQCNCWTRAMSRKKPPTITNISFSHHGNEKTAEKLIKLVDTVLNQQMANSKVLFVCPCIIHTVCCICFIYKVQCFTNGSAFLLKPVYPGLCIAVLLLTFILFIMFAMTRILQGRRLTFTVGYSTRKLCYRKDDRAMRPIYGCPQNFRDSLTTPTATSTLPSSSGF